MQKTTHKIMCQTTSKPVPSLSLTLLLHYFPFYPYSCSGIPVRNNRFLFKFTKSEMPNNKVAKLHVISTGHLEFLLPHTAVSYHVNKNPNCKKNLCLQSKCDMLPVMIIFEALKTELTKGNALTRNRCKN